jgi:hypothetical protein
MGVFMKKIRNYLIGWVLLPKTGMYLEGSENPLTKSTRILE